MVSVSTAGATHALRVQVWRRLRSLGAVYLQQSVCLLPALPEVVPEVRRLTDEIEKRGGTARVLTMALTDREQERSIVAEFDAARDVEYAEVLDRLPALRQELAHERARGNATYAEVEESEVDLERFRKWLAKIAARDYFGAQVGRAARAAVEDAAVDLAAFEDVALDADGAGPPLEREVPRLRAVDDTA